MQYRKLGDLDKDVSVLGFGCMRLPSADEAPMSGNVMEEETTRMIRHAIDSGVNYIDTAYRYHRGNGEGAVGRALRDGYRDKVTLVTKSPMMMIKSARQYDDFLDEQLERLGVEHIDLYLLHALDRNTWDIVKREDIIGRAEAAQKAGKIGRIGFSFHDSYDVFENIILGYDKWTACQFQYNFMDTDYQAGTKGAKLAAERGVGAIVMEPLRGGKLGRPLPEVSECMRRYDGYGGSLADLSLQWLWSQPEVSIVLSGMSAMWQLEENLASAGKARVGLLTPRDLEMVAEIKDIYEKRPGIPCTGCSYCMPCPQDVNIPYSIELYNEAEIYDFAEESKRMYFVTGGSAKNCIQCGECEQKCPQHIPISEWMPRVDAMLAHQE